MLELQDAQNFVQVAQKEAMQALLKGDVYRIAPKVTKYIGCFSKKICCQELSTKYQSGHTA